MRSLVLLFAASALHAQFPGLTLPPSGGNQRASVTQYIGPVRVTIDYSSPAVHGPASPSDPTIVDRRGKIWGQLVPYGLTDLGFGHRKPAPWRAGANQNTTFEVSDAVTVQGQPLAAGKYGLHMIPGPDEWTVIFSRTANEWGSFFYEESNDALRVKAKPRKNEYREWLTYEFPSRKADQATVELQWEELAVGWTVAVPEIDKVHLSHVRQELHNETGFSWQAWTAAVQFCLQRNINLEEALRWSDYAISAPFVGQSNYQTLSTKAQVLGKLGRSDESAAHWRKALEHPATTSVQIHQYGRQLLTEGKAKDAMEIFQLNAKRNGDAWPVHVGLARGYAAVGDSRKALEHARIALPQAPDAINKKGLQAMIEKLEAGKPI